MAAALAIALHSPVCLAEPESHKYFVDESGRPIEAVCVVASYHKASGIAVGPDGKGGKLSAERYLLKPFRYASSDNFFARLDLRSSIIIPIPPVFAINRGFIADQVLFLKPGYLPLLRRGDYDAKTETLSFVSDAGRRAEVVVDAILRRDASSSLLQEYFLVADGQLKGSLVIDYSAEDDAVLRSCFPGGEPQPGRSK